jgi:transcriptional regulator with GAF, ATPase, and Fis domain
LAESQLFGHTKGAFSGAVRDEPGFVRSAHRGTVLLDEIGDLPDASQPILLRVLQDMRVVPVGSARSHQVDVRFVAATHKDVTDLVGAGSFRRDLLARLNGFTVRLPPLRERKADLGLVLADLFSKHFGDDEIRIAPEAGHALLAYSWPANVRELEQSLLRARALSTDNVIRMAQLPPELLARSETTSVRPDTAAAQSRFHAEAELKQVLVRRLEQHRGNVSEVARSFGKARIQIQRWMKRFNLHAAQFRR